MCVWAFIYKNISSCFIQYLQTMGNVYFVDNFPICMNTVLYHCKKKYSLPNLYKNKNEITFLEAIVSKINLHTLLKIFALLSTLIPSDFIWSHLVSSYRSDLLISSNMIWYHLILYDLVKCDLIRSYVISYNLSSSDIIWSNLTTSILLQSHLFYLIAVISYHYQYLILNTLF